MNIKFDITLKELNKFDKEDVLRIFEAFQDFMCQYEEHMTFSEAERYWKKYEKVNNYIKTRFNIDDPERLIHERIFGKER